MADHKFDGRRFSDLDFTAEDRAQIREMQYRIIEAWPAISAMSDIVKGGKAARNAIAVGVVLGGAVAYFAKQGFFG